MDRMPYDGLAVPPPPPPPRAIPPRPASPRAIPPRPPLPPAPGRQDTAGLDAALADLGLTGMTIVETEAAKPPAPLWRRVSTWVAAYGVVLALIAFWPQPVDAGAERFLRLLFRVVPLLTYERLEFGSNIVLFIPFGVGLALLLRELRYLIMPLALLVSLAIESVQAVLIAARTPSLYDIIANVAGACVGLIGVVVWEQLRRRRNA